MSYRLDRPDGSNTEDRERSAANGAGAADRDESEASDASVHLDRPQSSSQHALPESGEPEAVTARPRWSQPRGMAERSDVVVDASHLAVDELSLEIEGDLGIKHLRLDTKGLEAQLFLKADLGNVVSLVETAGRRTPSILESAKAKDKTNGDESKGHSPAWRVAPPAGAALAGLAAGGALVARSKPSRWIARRALDRVMGRSALQSFVRGLN
jgi:hypothetical protein